MAQSRGGRETDRWWIVVATGAALAVVVALVAGVVLTPKGAEAPTAVRSGDGLEGIAAAALETLGLDSGRVLALRDELVAAFELRRDDLPPEAVASVEANLADLDRHIAELSEALERDPDNPELARLLASAYRRQVEMLRRVERIAPDLLRSPAPTPTPG